MDSYVNTDELMPCVRQWIAEQDHDDACWLQQMLLTRCALHRDLARCISDALTAMGLVVVDDVVMLMVDYMEWRIQLDVKDKERVWYRAAVVGLDAVMDCLLFHFYGWCEWADEWIGLVQLRERMAPASSKTWDIVRVGQRVIDTRSGLRHSPDARTMYAVATHGAHSLRIELSSKTFRHSAAACITCEPWRPLAGACHADVTIWTHRLSVRDDRVDVVGLDTL
jgi:hypothetical protein